MTESTPTPSWKTSLYIDPDRVDGDERTLTTRAQRILTDVRELSVECIRVRDQHRQQIDDLKRALEASEERVRKAEADRDSFSALQAAHRTDLLFAALKQIDAINKTTDPTERPRSERIETVLDTVFRDLGVTR